MFRTLTLSAFRAVLFAAVLALSGCLYLDTKLPLDTDVAQTTLGTKTGVSSVHSVLWLVAWGDGGTEAAAKNGGLKVINHLDSHAFQILWGLYSRVDTIAYGE